jgi:hypothetical protein
VSFQANKTRAVYRWFKYKEAFSAGLLEYLYNRYDIKEGALLDPFAGSGTALFTAGTFGLRAEGIELLPIGQEIISTKQLIDWKLNVKHVGRLEQLIRERTWKSCLTTSSVPELRITRGAYPKDTEKGIGSFLSAAKGECPQVEAVLRFALLCILESVSYTRKDGQYLRWDYRSGRRQGARPFDKGTILDFETAITDKLAHIFQTMIQMLSCNCGAFPGSPKKGIELLFIISKFRLCRTM